jgi:uncharacterized membrane protein YhaH (DUF805 family)
MTIAGIYSAPAARVADPPAGGYSRNSIWSPRGRIGRVPYIAYSVGFGTLINAVGAMLAILSGEPLASVFMGVALIAFVCIHALLSVQRAHDFDMTEWLAVLAFVPLVNFMFWFVAGTSSENRFGKPSSPNSKEVIVAAWIVPIVLIAGILAAIVIPAYMDFVVQPRSSQSG